MIIRDPKLYCARAKAFSKTIKGFETILVVKSFRQDGIRLISGGGEKILDDQLVTGFNSSFNSGGIVEAIMDDAYFIAPDGMQKVANASPSTAFQNAQFFFHQPSAYISGVNTQIDQYTRMAGLKEKLTQNTQDFAMPDIIHMARFFECRVFENQQVYEIRESAKIPFSYFTYWSTRVNTLGYGKAFFAYTREPEKFIERLKLIANLFGHDCSEVMLDDIPVR
jgi:hypothetical protein